ncbi:MAG TPA: macro domain-containing protein [Polyangiaceae bacterium LLY-WYZ-15_(1-7)]|nr:macro domain-containing protein [Polyangiaceae bacterium LLY-WYZ-15_(1-7)]HJL10916.1 macro domain-containing protein [Polyangiaceae bacterium LLY-WYZ-15_(1-7)]HJL23492.1 macro domain-containing protein [Polyangiaceae bacterium LLY-WYZ-15_(1-7)]HJL29951.1 macro domain-containing protein [Polyangiaceae bacterium LLY-WYZ-15_(1-7)]HJL34460.1 macro domain-containing protein [Polyangiaceae bacterium LLY-WYZ-15_(1-7)]
MRIKVVLCDINPKMVAAWRETFEENPEVEIVHGSMLDMQTSAWVSPTNSKGSMDGGLDAVIKNYFGGGIEKRVQAAIADQFHGAMPVGFATCVPTQRELPRFLISTPTMVGSSENISDTMNVALACAAAFQAVHQQHAREPNSIRSVALPGLGAATGQTPAEICADLMWTAYDLFRWRQFADFGEMRKALEEILGDLGPTTTKGQAKIAAGEVAGAKGWGAPAPADEDYDFDDDEDFEAAPTAKAPAAAAPTDDFDDFDDEEDFD